MRFIPGKLYRVNRNRLFYKSEDAEDHTNYGWINVSKIVFFLKAGKNYMALVLYEDKVGWVDQAELTLEDINEQY